MVTSHPPEGAAPCNAPSIEAAFQAVPPELLAQILDGELHVSPHAGRTHTRAASCLGMLLGGPFCLGVSGPGGWAILHAPEIHLGSRPDKIVPDRAGWRRERLSEAAECADSPAHYDLAPDWVCEVLSERTRHGLKDLKMRIYAREGVRHLWHVDAVARTLDVFRLEGGHWVLVDSFAGDARVRAEPFEALELDLTRVWSG